MSLRPHLRGLSRHNKCAAQELRRTSQASSALHLHRRSYSGKDKDKTELKSFLDGIDISRTSLNEHLKSLGHTVDRFQASVAKTLALPQLATDLPRFLSDMKEAFEFKEASIGAEILQEDETRNVGKSTATVRTGNVLCQEEKDFASRRLSFTRAALAQYLNLNADDIHPDDVPIIGLAASGGGLRACINTTCYYEIMQEEGLYDISSYLAGISGSTWAQAMLFNESIGDYKASRVLTHLKDRAGTHIIDAATNFTILQDKKFAKYILRSLLQRFRAGYRDIGLTDIYGVLLANRFLLQSKTADLREEDLVISGQIKGIERGENPMPLYSCVRQEIPAEASSEATVTEADATLAARSVADKSYFQFFEFSPFEFGSEELDSWIPTWACGRRFSQGVSIDQHPEVGLTTLLGIFSSAFCAPLSAYLLELEPFLPDDSSIFALLKKQIATRDEELKAIQLIDATKISNFARGMALPDPIPKHMSALHDLELSDAGMENNLPMYPLLRRKCDIIIAVDSSAHIETTPWFSRTEGYAKQRSIESWPIGIGWPKVEDTREATPSQSDRGSSSQITSARHESARHGLEGVNVWVGRSSRANAGYSEVEQGGLSAQMIREDWETVSTSTGVMLIYLPMLPNAAVPGIDPDESEHLSTWNFVYSADQIEGVRRLARANFDKVKVRKAVEAMYLRKKETRLQGG